MTEIVLPILHCLRCGGEWPPRKPELPIRCPKCGSPYWRKPRRATAQKEGEQR